VPSFLPDFTSKPSKKRKGLMLFCLRGGLQFFAFEQEEDGGAGGNSSEERIIDPQSKKTRLFSRCSTHSLESLLAL